MSDRFAQVFDRLLNWLEKTFPTVFAVGLLVYNRMLVKLQKEQALHDKTKLEKELVENELEVEKDFAGRSDADIIKSVSKRDSRSPGSSKE